MSRIAKLRETIGKFKRPFLLIAAEKRRVSIGLLSVMISAVLILAMPVILGRAVDAITGDATAEVRRQVLFESCVLFAALAVIDALLRFLARHQLIVASRRMEERLKADLMAHLQRLPITWFDTARAGDLISRFTQDVELLRFVTGPSILYGGQAILIVPGGLYLMLSMSPAVAGTAVLLFIGLQLCFRFLLPKLQKHSKAVQESIADISQRAAEDFAGIRVIQCFARARIEAKLMAEKSQEYRNHNLGLARLRAWINLAIHSCMELVVLTVLVGGATSVIAGELTIGELMQFLALLGIMVWPLLAIGWILASLHRAIAAADRIEEVFAASPESDKGESPTLAGHIVVRELSFSYPEQKEPALSDLSFELLPNQKLGITGPIGCGKTTLLALLLRLYDPPPGTIFVDGFDVLDLAPQALRRAFALAPQDPFLFSDTIEGNIDFGMSQDDPARRDKAVWAAGLDQDIEGFELGLETIVGERGVTLSGGQKQRVSLARALASDRAALILDDTLSAVDHATEKRILQRLSEERGDRTLLIAAHRLSIVADADLIVVLEEGRLSTLGTHDELLHQGGYYADVWQRQCEESALEGGEET